MYFYFLFFFFFRLLQFIGGVLFILCLLTEGYLMNGSVSSVYDYFPIRIVMGILIGIIYLSAVVFQWWRINLSLFTCSFGMAIGITLHQTNVSFELFLASILLLYAVIILNFSQSTWFVNHSKFQPERFDIPIGATINARKLKPLIYLIGAKLLTIFCYYLPFLYCTLVPSRSAELSYSISYLNVALFAVTSFNHLIILLLTRIVLGTFTIFFLHKTAVRDNINYYLTFIYLILLAILFAAMLTTIVDLNMFIVKFQWFGVCLVAIYMAYSFVVDVICQQIILFEKVEFNSATATISITFATFIEHLIDILVSSFYLNDWIGTTYILAAVTMAGFTFIIQQVSNRTSIFKYDRIDAQCILWPMNYYTWNPNGCEIE